MMTSSRVGTLKLDKFNPTASHHPVRCTLKLDKFNPTASHHPVRRTLKMDNSTLLLVIIQYDVP